MDNETSKKIALSVLQALFRPSDVKKIQKRKAIVLAGFPGCGKTTIAELLGTAFGFERFSTDKIRADKYKQKHRKERDHELVMMTRYFVYEELADQIVRALQKNKRVVVDGTHMDDKRIGVLGAVLSQLPSEKVAMIVIRTPQWIIKERFSHWDNARYKEWWELYRYWKKHVKDGKASFPTKKAFSQIEIIRPKRYAIRTFDWVVDIKGIVWSVNGTLFKAYGGLAGSASYAKDLGADLRMRKLLLKLNQLRHFVFSDLSNDETRRMLEALGLRERLFTGIFCTDGFKWPKSDVRSYRSLIRKARVRPHQLLSVGDSEHLDILPAEQAGMRTCLVYGSSKVADVCLPNHYEVAELFGREV